MGWIVITEKRYHLAADGSTTREKWRHRRNIKEYNTHSNGSKKANSSLIILRGAKDEELNRERHQWTINVRVFFK